MNDMILNGFNFHLLALYFATGSDILNISVEFSSTPD